MEHQFVKFKFERSILNNAIKDLDDYDFLGNLTPKAILRVPTYTDSDAVCEWAARLCYNSNDKFGTVPTFINGLMKAEHYDVIEHGVLEINAEDKYPHEYAEELFALKQQYPYIKFKIDDVHGRDLIISANLRVWRQLLYDKPYLPHGLRFLCTGYDLESMLMYTAPNIFGSLSEFFPNHEERDVLDYLNSNATVAGTNAPVHVKQIVTDTGAIVTMLAKLKSNNAHELSHATFQIDNVSRAFTHQHVRHRLLSHSQASQRYIDANGADYIYPPNMTAEQKELFEQAVDNSLKSYKLLRDAGLKKEDARAVLPNCVTTRIVSSAYIDGWEHYIKLRNDKAAQYEIRRVAQAIEEMLQEAKLL